MRSLHFITLALAVWCVPVKAQFATEFPPDAATMTSEALRAKLAGATFTYRISSGAEIGLKFNESHAFVTTPNNSDSAPWKIEASALCITWTKFPGGCSEFRLSGGDLYFKRSNGEVVRLIRK